MLRKNLLIATVFCLIFSLAGFAQFRKNPLKKAPVNINEEVDMSGEIDGAPYRIRKPAAWNGVLLVYGHGYRDKADHPGEVDNRNADIAPDPGLEPILLGQGYALAGSAYKDNGWAVEEGYVDSLALVDFFKTNVGVPERTLFWGFSMGSVIGFKNAETTNVYDGVMCGCAVGSGSPQSWDAAGDLLLAYDVVFGMDTSWGNPGDVRDDIDFETEVLPKLGAELNDAVNFPAFEFIRLVVGVPGRGINPPDFFPGWAVTDMFFTTEARSELERRAGGAIVQNLDRNYDISAEERAYLNGLGVPDAQIDAWLSSMNNQRIFSASESARIYLKEHRKYTGNIRVPVLTLHTTIDELVPVTQENAYARIITSASRPNFFVKRRNIPSGGLFPYRGFRRSNLLYQTYTDRNGHCNFTGEQLITAINVLNDWVATKMRPTAADFPEALGFDNDFVPPPPNQP